MCGGPSKYYYSYDVGAAGHALRLYNNKGTKVKPKTILLSAYMGLIMGGLRENAQGTSI